MKALIYLVIAIASLWLVLSRSDLFLITGSDVIDSSYKYPSAVFIGFLVLSWFFGILLLNLKQAKTLLVILTFCTTMACLVTSQAFVKSGKLRQLEYYVAGIQLAKIKYDPTANTQINVSPEFGFRSSITMQNQSMVIVSGVCPICLDLSELNDQ